MNTQELVAKALVPVREFFISTPPREVEDWEDSPKGRYLDSLEPIDHGKVARLRLDWELTNESGFSANDSEAIGRLITEQLKGDLVDIIENGDITSNDVSLKSMNGAVVRGKNPTNVRVDELVWYRESRPKRKAYEYTVFLLLTVDWEE